MKKTWPDKLKDPRWQKKRLEVLSEHNWECESCGRSDTTLNVHHGYYESGNDPWEYDNDSLHCLCCDCHKHLHSIKKRLDKALGFMTSYENILGYIEGKLLQNGTYEKISLNTYEEIQGAIESFGYIIPANEAAISAIIKTKNGAVTEEQIQLSISNSLKKRKKKVSNDIQKI